MPKLGQRHPPDRRFTDISRALFWAGSQARVTRRSTLPVLRERHLNPSVVANPRNIPRMLERNPWDMFNGPAEQARQRLFHSVIVKGQLPRLPKHSHYTPRRIMGYSRMLREYRLRLARMYYTQNLSSYEIARRLGLSRDALIGHFNALGIPLLNKGPMVSKAQSGVNKISRFRPLINEMGREIADEMHRDPAMRIDPPVRKSLVVSRGIRLFIGDLKKRHVPLREIARRLEQHNVDPGILYPRLYRSQRLERANP
ncbi:hypothetical protein HYS54_02260 [Candidatus Micrarchaeota archaeon]|nr:hypothetical protein [Candidatus Micrarchaeota archaeon]